MRCLLWVLERKFAMLKLHCTLFFLCCVPSLTLAFTSSAASQSVMVTRLLTVLCRCEPFDQHPWNWLGYFQAGISWSQNEKSMAADLYCCVCHLPRMFKVNPVSCAMLFEMLFCFLVFWHLLSLTLSSIAEIYSSGSDWQYGSIGPDNAWRRIDAKPLS